MVKKQRPYIPTFNGRHNFIKSKVLLVLLDRKSSRMKPVSCRELSKLTGVGYKSLSVLLSRWTKWGIVTRIESSPYTYLITRKARRWLARWHHLIPLQQLIEEIKKAQNLNT